VHDLVGKTVALTTVGSEVVFDHGRHPAVQPHKHPGG
jgi:hypothetical protein